jgi:tRNA (adenine37-N6)-methyltransferase
VEIKIRPIGFAHTSIKSKEEAPIQGVYSKNLTATLEIYPEYAEGLQDIEMFSHLILLYHFDRAGEVKLVRQTFLDDNPHGIFASRHPCRPNGIGLTIVKLKNRLGNLLEVEGIDVLDGTPIIDIKPYIPRFDCFPEATDGWLADLPERKKPSNRE